MDLDALNKIATAMVGPGKGILAADESSGFAFADRLVHAKDIQQVIALQTEFVQAQMKELAEQAKELGEAASKIALKPLLPKA
jgi:hypothetical protein